MDLAEIFPWNDNFATGITSIDDQHKKLVQLLNRLANHLACQADLLTLGTVFSELADYAVHHFKTEEAIWQQYLPDDGWEIEHKQTHEKFLTGVLELKAEENCKPFEEVVEDILAFLTHWLAFHILESDQRMAKVVLALQTGMSLESAKMQADREMAGSTKVLIDTVLSMYDNLSARTMQLMREITERQKVEAKLRLAANVFQNTLEAICITDAKVKIIDVNPAFCRVTQLNYDEIIGTSLQTLKSGLSDENFAAAIWQTIAESDHWSGEVWNRAQSGELNAEWLTLSAVKNEQNVITNYVGVFSDITHLIQHQRKLERIAHHDALTGLPNRLLLSDRLEMAIAHAERTRTYLAVCYLDLDGFKPVNDRFGHATGDQVLKEISQRFLKVIRGNDTVARLGGDEFVILFGDLQAPEGCQGLLDRLLQESVRPIRIKTVDDTVQVSASIGVAMFPTDGGDPDTLLHQADQAMYLAKRSGKSKYHRLPPP